MGLMAVSPSSRPPSLVTRHPSPLPPRSVFHSRTVSSPPLDRRCPLTTVVKGRAAQMEHRPRGGQTQSPMASYALPTDTTNPTSCRPVFPLHRTNTHRESREQLSSAQHSTFSTLTQHTQHAQNSPSPSHSFPPSLDRRHERACPAGPSSV